MPGKKNVERGDATRDVELRVDGEAVELNGFVQDIFQEVLVGLVRSLGTDDEEGAIEIRISPRRPS